MIHWRIDTPETDLPAETLLSVTVAAGAGPPRIGLRGELHGGTTALLRGAVERLACGPPRDVVVDCSELLFLGAAGAACLVQCHRMITARGGRFLLTGLSPFDRRVLEALGLLDQLSP